MGWQQVRFVGLRNEVWLPDDIEVVIDIVPDRFIGWVRSGQHFTGQTKTTFHDPGVSGQNAWSQRNYLHNGPSENGQRRQVGFNFASDDVRIIQLTPCDEVTWAAGTPEGNRTSWHNEACYGPNINWDRGLYVAVALHAGLIEAQGLEVDTALVKHQYWFGKWCPAQILNRGLWPTVVSMVHRQVAAIKAAKAGIPSATISKGDICAATTNLNIRAEATTGSDILYTLSAGQETLIRDAAPVDADGYRWWPVQSTTEKGEIVGWAAEAGSTGAYLVVTKDAEEPTDPEGPKPEYPKPLAIAELAPYVGRPIVPMSPVIPIPGDGIAIPMFDRARALRDTRRARDFTGTEDTGPLIKTGEEFDVSFLAITRDGPPMFVSPFWTRIAATDVEIISDTPKNIEPAEGAIAP